MKPIDEKVTTGKFVEEDFNALLKSYNKLVMSTNSMKKSLEKYAGDKPSVESDLAKLVKQFAARLNGLGRDLNNHAKTMKIITRDSKRI